MESQLNQDCFIVASSTLSATQCNMSRSIGEAAKATLHVHRDYILLGKNVNMDMKASADSKSWLYPEGAHSQKWPLPETLSTSFSSAREVIHSQGETLYLYLHSKNRQTTKQNTREVVYSGLQNQGATCYLNSALQILFMTKEFREAVESPQITDNKQGLLYQLQQLFKDLQGDRKCVSTVNITHSLSIENVCEQQDAVEWFEKILSGVSQDASKVYEGRWQKSLRCLKKDHEEYREDNNFFSLPLAIDVRHDEVFNVVDGLQAFFKTTRLDEDDWLYCDACEEKTDTEISFNLQKCPTILALHLKRFYFDYMKMGYQKNCCSVDIPPILDYFKSCTYDLYGVINHSGGYGGGHYCAYIKSPDNNEWYCFDDSQVSKMTDKDFLKRSRTAYMIVYRKRESLPSSPQPEENNIVNSTCEVFMTAPANELRLSMPEEIKIQSQSPIQTNTRVSKPKKCPKKRKEERSGKVTKTVCNKESSSFGRLTKKVPHKFPYITPGTVLVLRTGRHQGKRVVFLKHLPSGLLLLTGPFALNRVPLSSVSPNSVTATTTKVDISRLNIPDTVTDSSFRRRWRRESDRKKGHDLEMERLQIEQRKRDQRVVDSQVLRRVRMDPQVRRSLSSRPHQHDLLKSRIGWIISLLVLLMLHLHAVNIDLSCP